MSQTVVWVGQSASGANDGSSAANCRSAAFFNTAGNWGSGGTQIGPGTTVRLTGSISTGLTTQGSGSNGNPIVIDGQSATGINFLHWNSDSWITVRNIIFDPTLATDDFLYVFGSCSNIIIENNTADNCTTGFGIDQDGIGARPDNITVRGNYFRQSTANLGNTQHDIIFSNGSTNVTIEDNYLEMRIDGAGNNAHNDAIQTYERNNGGAGSAGPCSGWTVRYNMLVMNSNEDADRSLLQLEAMTGINSFYGNLIVQLKGAGTSGLLNITAGSSDTYNFYANTIVAKVGGDSIFKIAGTSTINVHGNIVDARTGTTIFSTLTGVSRSYNLYNGSGGPGTETGGQLNTNPQFEDYANNNFSLAAGSPARTTGFVFGSPYNQFIRNGVTWPGPDKGTRAVSGSWFKGAISPVITPPTNVQAV